MSTLFLSFFSDVATESICMAIYRRRRRRSSLCSYPGCHVLTTNGRCDAHVTVRRFDRDSRTFINSKVWRNLSALKLLHTPWCEICATKKTQPVPATQVDHILPRKTHPKLSLDQSNLQSLCTRCHARKTFSGR